jgi:hypothetical protein
MHRACTAAVLVTLLGCTPTTGAEGDPSTGPLARSAEQLPTVTVVLAADRTTARPGELVEFTVSATNTGAARVQLGEQCGPSMDVAIATPDGHERSALLDQVGPNGAFTCPLLPEHFAEPGQTRTQRISWVVPATPGTYSAAGGLRRGDGLGNPSAPVRLVVH